MAKAKKQTRGLPQPPPNRLVSVLDDPPRKNVLLLSCMDQRLLDDVVRFMNDLNLQNRYDQIALAGGAMGVHLLPEYPPDPSAAWWEVFTAHLTTAIDKLGRQIKDVFLLDHLDCGAYKELHPDPKVRMDYAAGNLQKMRELHEKELKALAWRVHEFCELQHQESKSQHEATKEKPWENIRISCFIVDLLGQVDQLKP